MISPLDRHELCYAAGRHIRIRRANRRYVALHSSPLVNPGGCSSIWLEFLKFLKLALLVLLLTRLESVGQSFTNCSSEVDRALDNLSKSGKLFNAPSRRESMPMMGGPRPYTDFGACFFWCKHYHDANLMQTNVWVVCLHVITQSATTNRCDRILGPTFRTFMRTSATSHDRVKPNR